MSADSIAQHPVVDDRFPPDSVGLVRPKIFKGPKPLELSCGAVLEDWELVYETYGELNSDASNAILICHALSGDHHAAGYHTPDDKRPGWWDTCVGPGKPIDTRRFYVVCPNNPGGCGGSTGPTCVNPKTGRIWGPDFPQVRVEDWVRSQALLADELGIERWAAVIGGSLGGMQALDWATRYPTRLAHSIVIASAMRLSAQNIAFNEIARQAITSDPCFAGGRYLEQVAAPKRGLSIARMVGHVTYLSDELMGDKFGRELRRDNEGNERFEVENYLRYQGDIFSDRFDANTYLLITRMLDQFDLARAYDNDPELALRHAQCKFLVLSFSSDWRFSPERSREIVNALIAAQRPVSYAEIKANQGHDAFLLRIARYIEVFGGYLDRVWRECTGGGTNDCTG